MLQQLKAIPSGEKKISIYLYLTVWDIICQMEQMNIEMNNKTVERGRIETLFPERLIRIQYFIIIPILPL